MTLPLHMVKAFYREAETLQYRGNPFIEALPPSMSLQQVKKGLSGNIQFDPRDISADGRTRAHVIASLLHEFFQPLSAHLQLQKKISIMIRQGYVGRNLKDGSLNMHMQNGYERVMTGDLEVYRFHQAKSTALSLSLIGCSGSGKSTTLSKILSMYPQVIFHEEYNFTQLAYLKVDCPHDGSLKNLCIQFFRAMDQVLHTDYETKYTRKRHGIDTLLAMMGQVANAHAIGVLVIDEIQHLSRTRSGGVEKMLNFFVTLVNVIGLPVVFVGTPKARPIFEKDLRSGRRGAGFGSLLWEPMTAPPAVIDHATGKPRKTEWVAFTDKLWSYQWLQRGGESLSEEVRACWYDLSQGVIDIVVKLFVLAQLRAIDTGVERITTGLLEKVYEDELKPVHPMLAALRSGDPDRIAVFSDLIVPDIDNKLLRLSASIGVKEINDSAKTGFDGNPKAQRLYNLLVAMDCEQSTITPLVRRVVQEHPELATKDMVSMVLSWYESNKIPLEKPRKNRQSIPRKDWHTLESKDLRFMYSQADADMYGYLKRSSVIFDMEDWLNTG
jgi:hypothetical protein